MRFLRSDVEGAAPVYAAPFLEETEHDGRKWTPGDFLVEVREGQLVAMGREEFLGKYRALNFAAPAAAAAAASSAPAPPEQLPAAAAIDPGPAPKESIARELEQLAARVRAL